MSDFDRLAADLTRAAGTVGAQGAALLRKTAFDIEATSKGFAPVDTGNLKGSIGIDFSGDGRTAEMSAEIGPTADYGEYVERGTARNAPQAYMGPAFDRHAYQFVEGVEQLGAEIL